VAQRNDQIFQVSLTEIAFCIAFILLLLLGYLVVKEQEEKKAALEALAKVQSAEDATKRMESAKVALQGALGNAGAANPDDIISKLIEAEKIREERDRLSKQVEDLDAKLTALMEVRELLEQFGGKSDAAKKEVEDALALQGIARKELESGQSTAGQVKQAIATTKKLRDEMKKQFGMEPRPADEGQVVTNIVSAAARYGELSKGGTNVSALQKENSGLRGQVAFLKKRLDARGGRDYPPCWADETGKVEFLFAIELKADSVVISPAWPARRDADAKALPGITEAMSEAHTYSRFPSAIQGIFNWSKSRDPECRHYVQLKSSIADAVQSDRARLMIENYFYKVEARR
jgi:hypothetical protein